MSTLSNTIVAREKESMKREQPRTVIPTTVKITWDHPPRTREVFPAVCPTRHAQMARYCSAHARILDWYILAFAWISESSHAEKWAFHSKFLKETKGVERKE